MKFLLTLLFLFSVQVFGAQSSIDNIFVFPGVSYVQSGASITTVSSSTLGTIISARNTTSSKTFYLHSVTFEGFFNVPSATATRLGTCAIQVPNGTTVATFNLNNPTSSQIDRVVFQPKFPIPVSTSVGFSCAPNTSTSTAWSVNYLGFEY